MIDEVQGTGAPKNGKRERSPSFPYIDLPTAVDLLHKLFAAAKMNEVRVSDVATAWGMASKSGSLLRYVAALGQFGLIETVGGGDHRRMKISQDGRRILEDNRPGVKETLISEAALKPKIVRGLFLGEETMPEWGKQRPSDAIAESSLKFDFGFGAEAARRFLTVYDATVACVVDNLAVTAGVDSQTDEALESAPNTWRKMDTDMQPQESTSKTPAEPPKGALNEIKFNSDGAGTVTISATLDVVGLELLEKRIAALKELIN